MSDKFDINDYYSEEDVDKLFNMIIKNVDSYYQTENAKTHPNALYTYGVLNGQRKFEMFFLNGIKELSPDWFEQFGEDSAKQLEYNFMPLLAILSAEAWFFINEEKVEGISYVALSVDGKKRAAHSLINRDENNYIRLIDDVVYYEEAFPVVLERYFDGVREFYSKRISQ
jgi:hypothetical protein